MSNIRSEYFTPSHVDDQLARGARTCVPACLALLDLPSSESESYPSWHQLLPRTSGMDLVIRGFDSLDELKVHLDYLFVATMNTRGGCGVSHAAVLYREEKQMGSSKCTLFNPGRNPFSTMDLNRSRGIQKWNNICAAFLPGTRIPAKEVETISFLDSSSDEEDSNVAQAPIIQNSVTTAPQTSLQQNISPTSIEYSTTPRALGDINALETQNESHARTTPPPTRTRRTPSRAAKRPASSGFYAEDLEEISPRPEYHRVIAYRDIGSIAERGLECTKEMIGQHIARYLLSSGSWVVWYHLDTQRFVIANVSAFSGYNIEGAEEGKDRFIGYAALADWAVEEGIYEASLKNGEGRAFLHGVGLENDPYKLLSSVASNFGKRKQQETATKSNGDEKKQKRGDAVSQEEEVDGVDDNEELVPSMPNATSPAASATNDSSTNEDDTSGKPPEEERSFDGGNNGQDDEEYEYEGDDNNDQTVEYHVTEDDEEESGLDQDQAAPKTTLHQGSNQEKDENMSDLEDEFNGAAVLSNLKESDKRVAVATGNQATVLATEIEELKAELNSKNEAEVELRAELEAKSNELGSSQEEITRLHRVNEDRRRRIDDLLATVRSQSNLINQLSSMLYNGNGAVSNNEE